MKDVRLPRAEVEKFAGKADLIILCYGKGGTTDVGLVERIHGWPKTVYIDGSETGKDRWRDPEVQMQISTGAYAGTGAPDWRIKKLARLYFRREKPYPDSILPLPFGIETRFTKYVGVKKDIDFACMFGQDGFPKTRQYVKLLLEKFCKENSFTCHTGTTHILPIGKGPISQAKYHQIWARAKVGISVGGGGYDTRRFWEILGNNCLLLTEKIDIYHPGSDELRFARIYEYNNLHDFEYQLEKVGDFLRNGYRQEDLDREYGEILAKHGTKARVLTILAEARKRAIIK